MPAAGAAWCAGRACLGHLGQDRRIGRHGGVSASAHLGGMHRGQNDAETTGMPGGCTPSSARRAERRACGLCWRCCWRWCIGRAPLSAADQGIGLQAFTPDQGLRSLATNVLLRDRDGVLWVGADTGLFRFDGHAFVAGGERHRSAALHVNDLYQSPSGRLWVGAARHLYVWEGRRLRRMADLPVADLRRIAGDGGSGVYVRHQHQLWHVDARRAGARGGLAACAVGRCAHRRSVAVVRRQPVDQLRSGAVPAQRQRRRGCGARPTACPPMAGTPCVPRRTVSCGWAATTTCCICAAGANVSKRCPQRTASMRSRSIAGAACWPPATAGSSAGTGSAGRVR